ncbi:PREDICTED: protein DYAD-like [Camelina sativa]|uniref:Protein DYAD-like n=1 Tax=Camelina sativa TaxID=90675 RepID=A0ABM0X8Z6_CAMSA|nr:PREDICTED: protein DYAD-like [Camelina sativa]
MSGTMFVKRNPIREATAGKNSLPSSPTLNVAIAHIRVGSYYEIDASILPQRSPENLKSIRVVMVSKITASDVSLRYPSMYSLRSHFDFTRMNRNKPLKKRSGGGGKGLIPVFDESHVMASELAGDLLYRRIAPHEVSLNRNSWSFWVSSRRNKLISQPAYNTRLCRAASPEGKCWSELKSGGMIKWGRRLRVQYKSRHIDSKKNTEGEEGSRVKEEGVRKEETEEEDDDDDGNETEEVKKIAKEVTDGNRKRKLIESSTDQRLAQRAKVYDQKDNQIVVYKRRAEKKFIDRWSVDRYKLAESNMLKVMKEKNAVFGNSILRPELRSEARKLIGDTGLLDHMLKHMAGKVAPGGQDRFMRKHNADGAMEYWLESSDLNHIRKEAGVEDPYWTPPPGWKLGDNPTQDPVCAGEIREIREELGSLKRDLEKLASKKEEDELVIVTTPNSYVTTQNVDHDNLMTPAKEIYTDLLKKKYKIEDQLVIIGETLREMEEGMGWLKKTVDENFPRKPDSSETPLLLEDSPTMETLLEGEVKELNKGNQITQSPRNREKGKKHDQQERSPLSLISNTGFRICRPVGIIAWPKLPALASATDSVPSNSNAALASSTSHQPSYPSLCPVKPLAAKRPLGWPFPFTVTPEEAPTKLFDI